MKETIRMIAFAHGFKDADAATITYITQMIERNYPLLTKDQISRAFELSACGKTSATHYGSFTAQYAGDVITAYLEFIRQQKIEQQKKDINYNQLPEPETNQYSYDHLLRYIDKYGKIPIAWDWMKVYFHMEDSGMIDESDEELKRVKMIADSEWQTHVKKTEKNIQSVLMKETGKLEYRHIFYCKWKLNKIYAFA